MVKINLLLILFSFILTDKGLEAQSILFYLNVTDPGPPHLKYSFYQVKITFLIVTLLSL